MPLVGSPAAGRKKGEVRGGVGGGGGIGWSGREQRREGEEERLEGNLKLPYFCREDKRSHRRGIYTLGNFFNISHLSPLPFTSSSLLPVEFKCGFSRPPVKVVCIRVLLRRDADQSSLPLFSSPSRSLSFPPSLSFALHEGLLCVLVSPLSPAGIEANK